MCQHEKLFTECYRVLYVLGFFIVLNISSVSISLGKKKIVFLLVPSLGTALSEEL